MHYPHGTDRRAMATHPTTQRGGIQVCRLQATVPQARGGREKIEIRLIVEDSRHSASEPDSSRAHHDATYL